MSNSLQPYGLQHIRLPCPTLFPGVCSNSCPLSQWCHPTISSSVTPFSSGVTTGGLSLKELVYFMQIIKFTGLQLIAEFPCVCMLSHFSCVWPFATLWTAACQASLSFAISWNLLRFMSLELMMPSNHLILCHPLLLLHSVFLSIRVFSSESALCIIWPKYWSFLFSNSPFNEYSGLIFFRIDGSMSLLSMGLSRVFSSTTIGKHQFFGAQPSLWSNSYIHTWPLEKPQFWLYGLLSAQWYFSFLICCLGWS